MDLGEVAAGLAAGDAFQDAHGAAGAVGQEDEWEGDRDKDVDAAFVGEAEVGGQDTDDSGRLAVEGNGAANQGGVGLVVGFPDGVREQGDEGGGGRVVGGLDGAAEGGGRSKDGE